MTANQIDAALSVNTEDVGKLLLTAGEDQWFERKSARINPKKFGAALVSGATKPLADFILRTE